MSARVFSRLVRAFGGSSWAQTLYRNGRSRLRSGLTEDSSHSMWDSKILSGLVRAKPSLPYSLKKVSTCFDSLDIVQRYEVLASTIKPRPIAFISTCSTGGCNNLAPVAFFMPVTSDPASLAFSMTWRRDGSEKDTLVNIRSTGHFVVNHTTLPIIAKVFVASQEFGPDVDEFEEAGLTPVPSVCGPAPHVLESPVSLECRLLHTLPVGGKRHGGTTVVIGQVVHMHVSESCIDGNGIRGETLQSVSRVEGTRFAAGERKFDIVSEKIWGKAKW
ncbi:Hypp3045 [Branchiostoma lanceolatum]|uniref:Hypp3045 protein n=1 Tax=Branchiostoma lanceolatum TaxID=7740 RepID=A0A8J9ZWA0_BRALA|nr:Hypp3045 [Branchiostoma lanceolatum]